MGRLTFFNRQIDILLIKYVKAGDIIYVYDPETNIYTETRVDSLNQPEYRVSESVRICLDKNFFDEARILPISNAETYNSAGGCIGKRPKVQWWVYTNEKILLSQHHDAQKEML